MQFKFVLTLALSTIATTACTTSQQKPTPQGHHGTVTPQSHGHQSRTTTSAHASRDAAVELLRKEGIMSPETRVVSAEWHEGSREWFIALKHPSGKQSFWFVDAAAQNYHGMSLGRM